MLVGNKSDLSSSRKTSRELGERFAEEEGLLFAEASAKSGEGVEGLFMDIGTFFFFLFFLLSLSALAPCCSLSFLGSLDLLSTHRTPLTRCNGVR